MNVSSVTTNFFPTAQDGFSTTTTGTVASGATSVPLASTGAYSNGDIVVLVIEPGVTAKQTTFTGVIDTGGIQVTGVKWTAGATSVSHTSGVTVIDYVSATHIGLMQKGIKKFANEDGTLVTAAVQAALGIVQQSNNGWTPLGFNPNTVTANGNRSYNLVFNGQDLTSTVSPGMRLLMARTVTSPTQCTSLNGSTQYYSKSSPAGMTFTDDFTVSAWVKMTSYGALSVIASRYNGTSGWGLEIETTGQIEIWGKNGGSGNVSYCLSYQSIPLNKWVHIQANLDMSAFTTNTDGGASGSTIAIDGVNVPSSVTRAGTNPTALIQAGNLEIGSMNGGTSPFPGKIAQVAIYSSKITIANVLATISQGLAGTETSLISAYSFNNSINDLNANANNLTANGSAVATNADTPFTITQSGVTAGTTNYGIVTAASFSTNTTLTVQVPEGGSIPTSGGVSAVSYSTVKVPFGFPSQTGKWRVELNAIATFAHNSPTQNTWYNDVNINIPIGEWNPKYEVNQYADHSVADFSVFATLSTANNSETDKYNTAVERINAANVSMTLNRDCTPVSLAAATPYYLNVRTTTASVSNFVTNNEVPMRVWAECAYL